MSSSRRQFLVHSTLASLSAAALAQVPQSTQAPTPVPTMGMLPPAGPEVSSQDIAAAEKLMQVTLSAKERAEAAENWRTSMGALLERRQGPRKVPLTGEDVPTTVWHPGGIGRTPKPALTDAETAQNAATPSSAPLPASDAEIAFSTVADLGRWIKGRKLTSERLTRIYLARLKRYDPQLKCVITLTEEHALQQARAADAEIAAGKYRGPLHGIPYGAKDLLDTAGIATTWGAEPFRNRVPQTDAAVIRMLNQAGAVLVAKLSLGALALNDVWFGGQTKNPWVPEEGSSGSSAGPGSAVAAGLVAFAIGSETQGSILSPSFRCGVTGLRPTFGRVPRTGAMTLSWSCDKLGPMARSTEDTLLVLATISGYDAGDVASVTQPLIPNTSTDVRGLRVGYFPQWMKEAPASQGDSDALSKLQQLGMQAVPVSLPDWPYDSLNVILFAEAAAAFEEITLDHQVDQLKMQSPESWPNTFRQSRFLSAVDFVQADRLRRKVAAEMAKLMQTVDLLLVPTMRDEMMVISNFTGHPALALPSGFTEIGETRSDWAPTTFPPIKLSPPRRVPYGITLVGRLFDEATLVRAGAALEGVAGVLGKHPASFA